MQPKQFDRLTVSLSNRLSRRRALAAGAAGLVGTAAIRAVPAAAQDATPSAAVDATTNPGFIYVQLAERGTWTPKAGDDGLYELALTGAGEQTLFFATGSERIVGTMPTDEFLETLNFSPENPPNAAIEVWTVDGERDVLVVQLMDPVLTRTYGEGGYEALTYDARVLNAYSGERLSEWLPDVDDDQLPLEFTNASLFIDSGCFTVQSCDVVEWGRSRGRYIGPLPGGNVRRLPDVLGVCRPWRGITMEELDQLCNEGYAACEGSCFAD